VVTINTSDRGRRPDAYVEADGAGDLAIVFDEKAKAAVVGEGVEAVAEEGGGVGDGFDVIDPGQPRAQVLAVGVGEGEEFGCVRPVASACSPAVRMGTGRRRP
jgi:hypothetical protein